MDTDQLIRALARDTRPSAKLSTVWRSAALLAVVLAAAGFFAILRPRADIAVAAETVRFFFKFVFTISLAVSAFAALNVLARPEQPSPSALAKLAVAPLLLAIAVLLELLSVSPEQWSSRLIGANSRVCLTVIPLIGLAPLAVLLTALRRSAPTRPVLAGAACGLLAGGFAASFYAMHCPDDSPLFVLTWYGLAIAALCLIGAAAAPRLTRW